MALPFRLHRRPAPIAPAAAPLGVALLLGLLLGPGLAAPRAWAETDPFPRPPELEDQVRFWVRVYSEVGTDGGLVHDSREMGIVYERIRFPSGASRRARAKQVETTKDKYDAILARLAGGRRTGLSADEERVLSFFPDGVSNRTLQQARRRIRFQLGQANKFRDGIVRSGRWQPHIARVLAEHGVPYELSALPHVESSYNPAARSHAGASGLWQFTRGTGRMFMRVDHVVDERNDPYIASEAAARLLLANYRRTGTWPLAITAYNHGTAGMERAIRQLGTRDIATIVHDYRSRSFGFASRNFYTSFLAAVEVERNAERFFGSLDLDPPENPEVVVLDHYYAVDTLERVFGVGRGTLRSLNGALLAPVWSGQKYVPKGYPLRLPRRGDVVEPAALLAQVPASERILRQRPDRSYRVHRGDTLSTIARRFGVSERDLVAMNGLRSRHRIYVGQLLKLPTTEDGPTTVAMVRDHSPNARRQLARPADGRYVVHRGDTLIGIAQTFGVSVADLQAANRLAHRNRIYVGQVLHIPGGPQPLGPTGQYVVQRGDTLEAIAARYGVDLDHLQRANRLRNRNRIYVGQSLVVPGDGQVASAYVVRRGDTLADIAQRHGTTVAALQGANRLANRNRIYPGQELALPGSARASVSAAEPEGPSPPAAAEPTATAAERAPSATEPIPSPTPPPASAAPAGAEPASIAAAAEAAEPAGPRGDLPGSPRRYAVAADGSIEVHPQETLGHYAEWLEIRARDLRRLNGLPYGRPLAIGGRLRLDFSRVDREAFQARRIAHHRRLQSEFFDAFDVARTESHVLKRGETLWHLSRGKYEIEIPVWLIQQYNPGLDVNALRPGMRIRIPVVEPRASS